MRVFFYCISFLFLRGPIIYGQGREWQSLTNTHSNFSEEEMQNALNLRHNQPHSSWHRLLQLLQESQILRQRERTIECLIALSSFTDNPELMEQALLFAKKGIGLCNNTTHRKDLFALYNNIGIIYFNQGHYVESYTAKIQSAQYAKDDPLALGRVENNMTDVLDILGKHNLAIAMLKRSIHIGALYKDGQLWANALQNLGCVKERKGDTDYVLYMDSSIRVAEIFKQYNILYRGLINKAVFLNGRKKNVAALRLLKAADTLLKHTAVHPVLTAKADEVRGIILTQLGQYQLAEQKLLKCLADASPDDQYRIKHLLATVYAQQGAFKKAYHTSRQPIEAFTSSGRKETILKLNDLEFQYRSAEKDKQLAENKLMLTRKDNALKLKNIGMGILAASGVTLSGILLLLQRNYRQKQKNLRAEQRNQELLARLAGEEQERKRISQELHDGIGGILSAAKMNLSSIAPASIDQESKYEQGIQLLDEAYNELRQTAHNLSPNVLKQKGLVPTLSGYCKRTAEAQNMDIRLQTLGQLSILDDETALTTYRMVQELLQNVVKHSGASKAMVQLNYQEGLLDITVEDNGKGISGRVQEAGIGLDNIRDRVAALKGHMEIDSRPGEGTTVYISI